MDLVLLRQAVRSGMLLWRTHALEQLLTRGIGTHEVREALLTGELIEDYADDRPFPSALIAALSEGHPLHVVVAFDSASGYAHVVTAYRPDTEYFQSDLRTRRQDG